MKKVFVIFFFALFSSAYAEKKFNVLCTDPSEEQEGFVLDGKLSTVENVGIELKDAGMELQLSCDDCSDKSYGRVYEFKTNFAKASLYFMRSTFDNFLNPKKMEPFVVLLSYASDYSDVSMSKHPFKCVHRVIDLK